MKFVLTLDSQCVEAEVRVTARGVDDRIRAIEAIAQAAETGVLLGYREGEVKLLDLTKVTHFFTQDKKVYARYAGAGSEQWLVRERMYELEESLPRRQFVRVSQSDIVALRAIDRVDTSRAAGLILVLNDGARVGISRRYIRAFKSVIGL